MHWKKTISMVEAHAEGEAGRVITGGIADIPGETMLQKMQYINEVDDSIRRFCVFEPRGYAQMSTNILLPPTRGDCDAGFIILQSDKAHAMSGSNVICVVTVLLETGLVEMIEPETVVRLDMPAGLVVARAQCKNGKCESVALDVNPSYVEIMDATVDVEGLGKVDVDIAFGGIHYGLIDPKQFDLSIKPDSARKLVDIGSRVHRAINQQLSFAHPVMPQLNEISYTMFIDEKQNGELVGATILPPGRIDRSPCGTGNSARLALRYARGEVEIGQTDYARSIIDSQFGVTLKDVTKVGDKPAVIPTISGRGWIHGMHQIGIDPSDPYPDGFMVSDCWGDAFDLLR